MPRYARAFIAGSPHHIVQRGHDRQPVFAAEGDFKHYLENLAEQLALREIALYAYCLMTNHVHLLVEPRTDGRELSSLMRVLAARQTRYVNRLERRSGTLWEGRFKCSLVDRQSHLLACCRYIELNPVRAGIVTRPSDYPRSSFPQRGQNGFTYLPLSPVGVDFDAYVTYVQAPQEVTVDHMIRTALKRNQLTGTARFAEAVAHKLGRRISNCAPGRPRHEGGVIK